VSFWFLVASISRLLLIFSHCNLCMQDFMTKWNQTLQIGFLGRVNSDIYKYSWSSMGGYGSVEPKGRKLSELKKKILTRWVNLIKLTLQIIYITDSCIILEFVFQPHLPSMKWVDNHKGVFNLTIQAVSSTHTQVLYISTHTQVLYISVLSLIRWISLKIVYIYIL
jgi:hypothetical protein